MPGCYQGDLRVLCGVGEKQEEGGMIREGSEERKWLPKPQVVPPVGRLEYRWSSLSSASWSQLL